MAMPLFYFVLESLLSFFWFTKNTQNLTTFIFAILSFLIILAASKFKQAVVILAIYLGIISAFSIFSFGMNGGDKAVFSIICLAVLIVVVALGYHPSFAIKNNIITNSDFILDDFDTKEISHTKLKIYPLRVHRIFSIVVVVSGLGLIFLGTFMTGGHISVEEGIGLIFLAFPVLLVSVLVWKFPQFFSYLIAITIFIGGFFLELALLEQMFRALVMEEVRYIPLKLGFILGQIGFIFSCISLIFIILSKTARQEWKMK